MLDKCLMQNNMYCTIPSYKDYEQTELTDDDRSKKNGSTWSAYMHAALSCFSCILLFVILWTVACQAPLSMGSSKRECWLPCPPPGYVPNSRIKFASLLHRQLGSLPLASPIHTSVKIHWAVHLRFSDLPNL